MIESKYQRLLKRLRETNPGHDLLLIIESVPEHLAVEYLRFALQDPITQTKEEYTLNRLQEQKSSLYSRRAVLSNKFHQCENDKQRREISLQIGSIQSEIIVNKQQLDLYYSTGKLPKAPDKLNAPVSGERRWKKLHSIRSSISRYNSLIRSERNPDKIKDYESKRQRLIEQEAELSA